MEDQMTTPTPNIRIPARSRGISLGFRVTILTLDVATIISITVALNLYNKWIPGTTYPTTALQPKMNHDWTDLVVLAAIVVSLTWTGFATVRSAWTSRALHLGVHVALEFLCLVWLLACAIPALMLRESDFQNLAAISNTCDLSSVTLMDGEKVPWVCMPRLNILKKLQVAAYSVAFAIAVLHFTLFALACRSRLLRPQTPTQFATLQHIEAALTEKPAHQNQESTSTTTTTTSKRSESVTPPPLPRIEVAEF